MTASNRRAGLSTVTWLTGIGSQHARMLDCIVAALPERPWNGASSALSFCCCRFLVAAGDPCQLPPLIASPRALSSTACVGSGSGSSGSSGSGLGRSLFERLVAAGLPAHLLRRQYRCHPAISAVPNRCFYGVDWQILLHGLSSVQTVAQNAAVRSGCLALQRP